MDSGLLSFISCSILLIHLLLLFSMYMKVMGRDIGKHDGVDMIRQRKLLEQRSSLKLIHEGLFQYQGDVLSRSERVLNTSILIDAIALSWDENDLYYVEKSQNYSNSMSVEISIVKKAEGLQHPIEMGYNLSYFAGPWPRGKDNRSHNSSVLQGLLMVDGVSLIVSDKHNQVLRRFDVTSGTQVGSWQLDDPLQMAKHPTQDAFFVSARNRIIKVPLTRPGEWNPYIVIAGPEIAATKADYIDSLNRSDVRFTAPMIGPQAISREGGTLYVADYWNNVVRRVDVVRGATETIAGRKDMAFSPEGGFKNPNGVALTAEGCNLFVTDRNGGGLHWLTLQHPGGNVTGFTTVAVVQKPDGSPELITSPSLSQDERYLFVGTGDGQILKLQLNVSALRSCIAPPQTLPQRKKGISHNTILIIGLLSGTGFLVTFALVCAACAFCPWCRYMRNRQDRNGAADGRRNSQSSNTVSMSANSGTSERALGSLDVTGRSVITEFPLALLQSALQEGVCLTGKGGGYGDVYRASLEVGGENIDVAIKVMRGELDEIKHKQFMAEVNTLCNVRHKNLCRLLGFCAEKGTCILVYPFIEGGSLYDRLHMVVHLAALSSQGVGSAAHRSPLDWEERMLIAKQVATCLRYLHFELEPAILHRDVKSSNVLVQGRGKLVQAFLCDFGLAKPRASHQNDGHNSTGNSTVQTTTTCGTPGYMPPEYVFERKLTMSTDVYAFGVVLLELLTGLLPIVQLPDDDSMSLCLWAKRGSVETLVDMSLRLDFTPKDWRMAGRVLKLALKCTDELASKRPSMKRIVHELETVCE